MRTRCMDLDPGKNHSHSDSNHSHSDSNHQKWCGWPTLVLCLGSQPGSERGQSEDPAQTRLLRAEGSPGQNTERQVNRRRK